MIYPGYVKSFTGFLTYFLFPFWYDIRVHCCYSDKQTFGKIMTQSAQNPHRLLLVGRDALLRKLRAEVLKRCGYWVFPATDHADAITRCKPGAYDAVLVSGEEDEQE